jgi:hypothetical protein
MASALRTLSAISSDPRRSTQLGKLLYCGTQGDLVLVLCVE